MTHHRATGDVGQPVHCHRPMTSLGHTSHVTSSGAVTSHLWACSLCPHLTTVTDHHPTKEA